MKRLFTFLMIAALTLGTSQTLVAQDGKWSTKVGAGWYSVPDFVGALITGLGTIDTTEGTSSHDFIPLINPNIELVYGVNDWISLGGYLSVGYASAESRFEATGTVNKSTESFYPTLLFSAETRYFTSGWFSMYGSWGIGAMALFSQQLFEGDTNTQFAVAPMANVYPLGFAFEVNHNLAAFLEIGLGAKGFFNVGVNF